MMYEISKLLPQKSPMLVLSSVLDCDIRNGILTAEMEVSEKCFYFDKVTRGVSSLFGIEYLAQTAGCYQSIAYPSESIIDLLLEVKNFQTSVPFFYEKNFYKTKIIEREKIGELLKAQGFILDDHDNIYCEAFLKIFRQKTNRSVPHCME